MSSLPSAEEIDEEKERAHFRAVVNAFKYYKLCSLDRIHKSEKMISMLPPTHQSRLDKYKTLLTTFKKCLDVNNSIVHLIIKDVDTMFENVDLGTDANTNGMESFGCNYNNCDLTSQKQHKMQHDVDKVQSVLKNLVRDWSDAGAAEREQCYRPILDRIEKLFPVVDYSDRSDIKILVPGAGLGRLAWEIAARGFSCQGNEFSLFMLFASNFILNKCLEANKYTVYPWVHQYVNHLKGEDQAKAATFPDVPPSTKETHFSMAAGDFLKVYIEENEWDCVASCFFIDCAPNVIEFIERIYYILRPGAYWINLGPLLYHYSDMPTEMSIEPPYDILLDIIKDVGFEILYEQSGVRTKYAQNPASMMQHEYSSVFFVCRKPLSA